MKTFDIIGPDEAIRPALVEKINNLTKPKGSLGMLESLALHPHYPSLSLVERRSGKTTNAAKQLDRLVGSPAAVERSPHPHRQNPGFAGKRCTIQLFAGKRHPIHAAAP